MIRKRIAVTTTGDAGSATGDTTDKEVGRGTLYAVYLDYHADAPATSDVTISQAEEPTATLLTVSDNKTDGWYFPRLQVCSEAGAGLSYDGSNAVAEAYPVTGGIKVAVAGADALTNCVVAYVYVQED